MPVEGTLQAGSDRNKQYTLMGLSGTLASTYGTAVPTPLTVTTDGKLRVESAAELSVGTIAEITTIADIEDGAGTSVMDTTNTAMRVNVVAGGAGGGNAQLQVRNPADDGWNDVGFGTTGDGTWNVPVHVRSGTVVTTASDIPGGTIDLISNLATGTITAVQSLPDLPGGTVDLVTSITTLGTLTGAGTLASVGQVHNAGTVAALPDLPGGTIDLVTLVTTVSNLTNGSVRMTVGTLTVMPNVPGGTLGLVTTVTNLSNGTIQSSGTTTGVGTVSAIGQVHNAGTVAALPDLPGGTIDSITNLAGGTIQLNPKPTTPIIPYGTTIAGTAAVGITLLAAPGSGTSIYLNDISVINRGTAQLQTYIGFGTASTAGTSQVLSGNMAASGGGIQKSYPKAIGGHITNLALLGSITAAGTVDVNLSYWVQ